MKRILEYRTFKLNSGFVHIDDSVWDLLQDFFDEFHITPFNWKDKNFVGYSLSSNEEKFTTHIIISFNGECANQLGKAYEYLQSKLVPAMTSMGLYIDVSKLDSGIHHYIYIDLKNGG